jgi:hypothetical protein
MPYDLSGGEIENVCRKVLMQEVITGNTIQFTEIKAFCKVKNLKGSAPKNIGFRKIEKIMFGITWILEKGRFSEHKLIKKAPLLEG